MPYSQPVSDLIKKRFSCRNYLERPIEPEQQQLLRDFMSTISSGPFGTQPRFVLAAASERDRKALKGLGTYGFIKGATGFIIGAVEDGAGNLEDFGHQMERIILYATDLGLGTCWLGGTFTKSRFAKKISATKTESVPAVTSVGYIAAGRSMQNSLSRQIAGSDRRLPWERLFFDGGFGHPLTPEAAGASAEPLEMVRLGPSASNKQPWRIVGDGEAWHFFLQRTPGYLRRGLPKFIKIADMQRIDMGIAMSHFQLAAVELGLPGRWVVEEPGITKPDELTEYTASWVPVGA
jgi:nitroreductase